MFSQNFCGVAKLPDSNFLRKFGTQSVSNLQSKFRYSYGVLSNRYFSTNSYAEPKTPTKNPLGASCPSTGGIRFGTSTTLSKNKGMQINLRERFIQRLIVDGKKSIATKIFDESLELLKERIHRYNESTEGRGKSENLYSLATLTKDEIFLIALRKAQP